MPGKANALSTPAGRRLDARDGPGPAALRPGNSGALLLQLDFDERELVIVRIDDVVFDAGLSEVGGAHRQTGFPSAVGLDELERAVRQGDDHIVVFVLVPARRRAGGELPLSHSHPIVVDQQRRGSRPAHESRGPSSGSLPRGTRRSDSRMGGIFNGSRQAIGTRSSTRASSPARTASWIS